MSLVNNIKMNIFYYKWNNSEINGGDDYTDNTFKSKHRSSKYSQ